MFSGIIEHQTKILFREGGLFRVENIFIDPLKVGQSIAHDGACMTLTNVTKDSYEFFTMQESLRVTNFGTKKIGDTFNVERCLQIGDRIDGHFVTGHIDTVGSIVSIERQSDDSVLFSVSYDPKYDPLVIEKGSITLNGVSLTVVLVESGGLTVSLIPLTQEWTNLTSHVAGDPINIEFDMMGKYIQKYLQK